MAKIRLAFSDNEPGQCGSPPRQETECVQEPVGNARGAFALCDDAVPFISRAGVHHNVPLGKREVFVPVVEVRQPGLDEAHRLLYALEGEQPQPAHVDHVGAWQRAVVDLLLKVGDVVHVPDDLLAVPGGRQRLEALPLQLLAPLHALLPKALGEVTHALACLEGAEGADDVSPGLYLRELIPQQPVKVLAVHQHLPFRCAGHTAGRPVGHWSKVVCASRALQRLFRGRPPPANAD
eukprot:scaffold173985_cov44-Prasinocladus_malaysianus.AAC.2